MAHSPTLGIRSQHVVALFSCPSQHDHGMAARFGFRRPTPQRPAYREGPVAIIIDDQVGMPSRLRQPALNPVPALLQGKFHGLLDVPVSELRDARDGGLREWV